MADPRVKDYSQYELGAQGMRFRTICQQVKPLADERLKAMICYLETGGRNG